MNRLLSMLAALALVGCALAFTSCSGEDGDDGVSATDLILNETGDTWYQYAENEESVTVTGGDDSSFTSSEMYIKYDKSSDKLVVAVVGETYYATKENDMTRGKWAASAVALRVAGKIKKADNPFSGKKELTLSNWGDFSIDALIKKLFEE